MLEVKAVHRLDEIEFVLRRVLQRHGAALHAVGHVGHVIPADELRQATDAYVYTICHADLYAALLMADIRFAAYLPCRIAAYSRGGAVTLATASPKGMCRLLNRPDLERMAEPLEKLLSSVLEEAARPLAHPTAAAHPAGSNIGATEGQVNARAALPQRVDRCGTKIEELAGTGEHDSAGG
ncbi:MAG: DUF302 domain-containing protein [Acidobacteria bacterium]|nr:DUF302 domain-containing protein [Acidobacteriota bacterium]